MAVYCQTRVPWDDTNSPIYYLGEDVGIGTNNPSGHLQVACEENDGIVIGKPNDNFGLNGGSYNIKFYGYRDINRNVISAKISAIRTNYCCNWLHQGMDLAFYTTNIITTSNADNSIERMRIKDNGNIGIRTQTPETLLEIYIPSGNTKGQIRFSGAQFNSGTYLAIGKDANTNNMILGTWANNSVLFYSNSTERMKITASGNILIGQSSQQNSDYKLDVNGKIRATEVTVNLDGADYVFDNDYELKPLSYLEKYIEKNNHLPDIEPAEVMRSEGVGLSNFSNTLLRKIEELTLYVIEQQKQIEQQNKTIKQLEKEIEKLKE